MKKSTDDILKSLKSKDSLDDFLKENESEFDFDSLCDYIEYHLITNKLSKADVIAASGIGREYGYQIINGTRKPSRDKLIMLCFGLRLTLEQTQRLLRYAGFGELYPKNRRDAVISYGLTHGYSIIDMNISLVDHNLDELK